MPLNPDKNSTLERVCLRLRRDDMTFLRELVELNNSIGLNELLRHIVHSHVTHFRDNERRSIDELDLPSIKLPEGLVEEFTGE